MREYDFKWLRDSMVSQNLTVKQAASKIGKCEQTIYAWLNGAYLDTTIKHPNYKDDVATSIGIMLGCDKELVREKIMAYLVSSGKLVLTDRYEPTFKTELKKFIESVKDISYYATCMPLTSAQRKQIDAAITLLENI